MLCVQCGTEITEELMVFSAPSSTGKRYSYKKCKRCINHRIFLLKKSRRRMPGTLDYRYDKYRRKKYTSKRRGIDFNLSFHEYEAFYAEKLCYYCGEHPVKKTIERVNSSIGYEPSNCVMVCLRCNLLKKSFSKDELRLIRRIATKVMNW